MPVQPTLNLGVLAHVDAGKTSLTERLLFHTGAIDAAGSVDAGTTRTDSMELERRRGITIRSAVACFRAGGTDVNLLDTPGHPDFIAEVERALAVLDAAVLVVSAVEGVQSQTVTLWRALRRVGVPALAFVNKLDRTGADPARVAGEVATRLRTSTVVLSQANGAARDPSAFCDDVALADDRLLDTVSRTGTASPSAVRSALRRGVAAGRITPVLFGSALTGAGVPELVAAIGSVLPPSRADEDAPAHGVVFKIDRTDTGRRVWVRMYRGRLHRRERVAVGDHAPERVTGVQVSRPGGLRDTDTVAAGEVAVLGGLTSARIGDDVGRPDSRPRRRHRFAPPAFESVVVPRHETDRVALYSALRELADQDPLIALRVGRDDEIAVSLYGEVQAEVLAALLLDQFGVATEFAPVTVVHTERVLGTGAAVEVMFDPGNPYLATIGLRVAPADDGITFALEAERGSMPPAFFAAIESGVRTALEQGPHGWRIVDARVTITHTGYAPRQSHAHQKFNKEFSSVGADFRNLAPVVLFDALRQARTQVCEPVQRIDLEVPDDTVGPVTTLLGRCGGVVIAAENATGSARLAGLLPAATATRFAAGLPGLTRGHAVLASEFDGYRPVTGRAPRRQRRGPDPGDRARWFREMPR